jgi:hypothetical protein
MHQGRSNYPKFQIHEKTPSILCWSEKLSGVRQRDQSLFSLLLEIESRLRKEGRNGLALADTHGQPCVWLVSNPTSLCGRLSVVLSI